MFWACCCFSFKAILIYTLVFEVLFLQAEGISENSKANQNFDESLFHNDDFLVHEKLKYTADLRGHDKIDVNKPLRTNADRLIRRNGVKVGHVEEVNIGENKIVQVITRAMKPLLFEIPNFLSDEECDHIIQRAKDPNEGGMFTSKAKGGLTPNTTFVRTGVNGKSSGPMQYFGHWERIICDNKITIDEIIHVIHESMSMILLESDVIEMFKALGKDEMINDGFISTEEFSALSTLDVEHYLDDLWKNHPRFRVRTSKQAWLFMEQWIDPTVHKIRERLVHLTGLPRKIIYGGEQLQVVHYYPDGHYHAHHDSETHTRTDIPCCHQYTGDTINSTGECKLCRFITFIMYLNDVEEGGATAFPVADEKDDYNADEIRGNAKSDKYNLSHGCKRANLLLKPKKGMAALWYNHLVNETNGWMGELDLFSLHGGCDVIKGEKWISNMWIPAPFGKDKDVPSIYLNIRDYELAEEKATHFDT